MVGEGITGPQEKVRGSIGEIGVNLPFLAIFIVLFLKKLIYTKNGLSGLFGEFGFERL
jgi:hypothetical protein